MTLCTTKFVPVPPTVYVSVYVLYFQTHTSAWLLPHTQSIQINMQRCLLDLLLIYWLRSSFSFLSDSCNILSAHTLTMSTVCVVVEAFHTLYCCFCVLQKNIVMLAWDSHVYLHSVVVFPSFAYFSLPYRWTTDLNTMEESKLAFSSLFSFLPHHLIQSFP